VNCSTLVGSTLNAVSTVTGNMNCSTITANTINGTSATSLATTSYVASYVTTYSLGYNQTYNNMTSVRSNATNYPNNTGRPIFVSVVGNGSAGFGNGYGYVNDVQIVFLNWPYTQATISFIVPPGATYKVSHSGGIYSWYELY